MALRDMPDVDFRIGGFGQLECTVDGEDYYLQWYPCSFREMAAPPELMVTYMDYLGVDMAVLQHDHIYGSLNEILGDCMKRYPGRFLPLAQIREWEADQEAQSARLEHAVESLGLKGLYFEVEALAFTGWVDHLDDAKFEPLWETVRRLGIPVFWYLYTSHRDRFPNYLDQVVRLDRWAKAHPDISQRLHPRYREHRHASPGGAFRHPCRNIDLPQESKYVSGGHAAVDGTGHPVSVSVGSGRVEAIVRRTGTGEVDLGFGYAGGRA